MWPFRRKTTLAADQVRQALLGADSWPWTHIHREVEERDDVLTANFYNTRRREGFRDSITLNDCYDTVWVERPIFGGPARPFRVLDDVKVELKMRETFGRRMQELGWLGHDFSVEHPAYDHPIGGTAPTDWECRMCGALASVARDDDCPGYPR